MLDVVAELDLSAFHARYRADGRGGAAYDPRLMLAVLIYAYALGERSSRRIERRLMEDVAFRVVAVNQQTDHATTARFRVQHEDAIAQLFGQVLAVCARAGVLRPGLVAIDGTKLTGNASGNANRSAVELAEQILKEAEATDAAEEAAEKAAEKGAGSSGSGSPATFGPRAGRRARLRELLEELQAEATEKSYEAHIARRAEIERTTGRPLRGRRPSPTSSTHKSRRQVNLTDRDSRLLKARASGCGLRGPERVSAAATLHDVPAVVAGHRHRRGCGSAPRSWARRAPGMPVTTWWSSSSSSSIARRFGGICLSS